MKRAGFTLIELTVIIVMAAVIASVVVPAWTKLRAHVEFDSSVQDVVEMLAWCREQARASQSDVSLQFDPQTETFTATVEPEDPGADRPVALQGAEEAVPSVPASRSYSLGENAAVVDVGITTGLNSDAFPALSSRAANEMRFHEDGSADLAMFALRSVQGHTATVTVYPVTGRVAVDDVQE